MEQRSQQDLLELNALIETTCTEYQQELLKRFYGIDPYKPHDWRELARAFHISQSRARKYVAEAQVKLNRIRICPSCCNEFRPYRKNQICCSAVCWRKLQWFKKKEEEKRKRAELFSKKQCLWCGEPLTGIPNLRRKYCNKNCASLYQQHGISRASIAKEKAKRKCDRCGRPLPWDAKSHQKYCSFECRELQRGDQRRRVRTEEELNNECRWCHKNIGRNGRIENRKYCSQRCSNRHRSHLRTLQKMEKRKERKCKYCRGPIPVACCGRAKFCSASCRQKARRGKTMAARRRRECPHCHKRLPVELPLFSKYCSPLCRERARQERIKEDRRRLREDRKCRRCGTPIGPEKREGAIFCTRQCKVLFQNEKRQERRKNRPCGHCGQPVPPENTRYCSPVCRQEAAKIRARAGINSLDRNSTKA